MRGTGDRHRAGMGFTLIELLVVIAVIILLMAILLPVLQRSGAQAREVSCLANLKQLGSAFVTYHGNYKGFLPSPAHSDDATNLNDLWDGDPQFPKRDDPPYTWKGKIQTYTATMTDESLAELMAAMAPGSMPETGGSALPICAMVVALGALAIAGGLGMGALRWHRHQVS